MSLLLATSPFTRILIGNFSSTKRLLLHFDGSNGSTTFTDSTGKTWTVSGGATISTSQSQFGGASGSFTGSSGISTPTHTDFALGSNNWQIDTWIRPASSTDMDFIAHRSSTDSNNFWAARRTSANKIRFFIKASAVMFCDRTTNGTTANATWAHIRINRIAGVLAIAIDGTYQTLTGADATTAVPALAFPLWLGAGDNTLTSSLNGFMDETLLDVGGSYNTTNFTPPAAPFTLP